MRRFEVDRGKIYRSKDVARIQIPPIDKTYLTKNSKLHFTFDLTYNEMSLATAQNIAKTMFSNTPLTTYPNTEENYNLITNTIANCLGKAEYVSNVASYPAQGANQIAAKPIPTLDINGAYGLISRIQVYDYLGTTLLEDIQSHDLLSALFVDFQLIEDSCLLNRPEFEDINIHTMEVRTRKSPCTTMIPPDSSFNRTGLNTTTITRLPRPSSETLTFSTNYIPVVNGIQPVTITYNGCINLVSFLGVLSNKFVPLHNGFTVEFHMNDFENAVGLSTIVGGGPNGTEINTTQFSNNAGVIVKTPVRISIDPSIVDATIKNMYIKADLLELTSDLDGQVEKIIQSKGYRYQLDFFPHANLDGPRTKFTRRILPELQSVTKVIIGQRPVRTEQKIVKEMQGYRIRNFTDRSRLLYNKAILSEYLNAEETYSGLTQSLSKPLDKSINFEDFCVDTDDAYGTDGFQFQCVSPELVECIKLYNEYFSKNIYEQWFNESTLVYGDRNSSYYQGKYLILHDLRLPEIPDNSIGGISTIKQVLEYEIESDSSNCERVYIDVFCEHDAFIHVDPGKSTAVSF